MALVDKTKITRIDLPHEPGEWIEMRPLTGGDLAATSDSPYMAVMQLLVASIVRWSYAAKVTKENVFMLDPETVQFLAPSVKQMAEGRGDEEKNASEPGPSAAPL